MAKNLGGKDKGEIGKWVQRAKIINYNVLRYINHKEHKEKGHEEH